MAAARTIKSSAFTTISTPPTTARSQWFAKPLGRTHHFVSRDSVSTEGDEEYDKWRNAGQFVQHDLVLHWTDSKATATGERHGSFGDWLDERSVEEIASLVDTAPTSIATIQFTPSQRLFMALWVRPPFHKESTANISTANLRQCAYEPGDGGRKEPLSATSCLAGGVTPQLGIFDLPVATGKTALTVSVAAMVLSDRFEDMVADHRTRRIMGGIVMEGSLVMRVARLAIVAAGGATFNHFVETIEAVLHTFRTTHTHLRYELWSSMGKRNSVEAAARLPHDVVVFWVVPIEKLSTTLKLHPEVAVTVCITDEFIPAPRERCNGSKRTRSHTLAFA